MRETYITSAEGEPTNNYEVVCENWRRTFLEMDQQELISRFSLESDEHALYIVYYSERYAISRDTGMITLVSDPERALPFNTLMTIYHLFYYSKPEAKIRGEFVPFRQVKRASPFDPAFQRTVLKPLAGAFTGHADRMDLACRALGGHAIRQGDVGYVVWAFDCIPLTVTFWDADEEFGAQANILFDADITDFLHEETVCCLAADLVRRLAEEAGLETENLLGAPE